MFLADFEVSKGIIGFLAHSHIAMRPSLYTRRTQEEMAEVLGIGAFSRRPDG
jgi:hypothetical protein